MYYDKNLLGHYAGTKYDFLNKFLYIIFQNAQKKLKNPNYIRLVFRIFKYVYFMFKYVKEEDIGNEELDTGGIRTRHAAKEQKERREKKEKEIEEINEKRLLTLQQYLENREKQFEEKRLEKIDRLKEKKDEEVEAAIIKSRKRRVKIIRNISKSKEKFINNNNRKRDIILDYTSFGSKVYAPLTRDGHNPDRHPFKFELNSYSLNTYDGLSEIQGEVVNSQNSTMASFTKPKMEKKYSNSLSKLEKVHIKAIKDAFNSIQKQELKKKEEEDYKKRKDEEDNRNKNDLNKKVEEPQENVIKNGNKREIKEDYSSSESDEENENGIELQDLNFQDMEKNDKLLSKKEEKDKEKEKEEENKNKNDKKNEDIPEIEIIKSQEVKLKIGSEEKSN